MAVNRVALKTKKTIQIELGMKREWEEKNEKNKHKILGLPVVRLY